MICLLLPIAWPFRWEKGPTQTIDSLKIIHFRDRWTGQQWIRLYGVGSEGFFSGEQRPHFSGESIKQTERKILADLTNTKHDLEASRAAAKRDGDHELEWSIIQQIYKIETQLTEAPDEARRMLTQQARRNQNIATGAWVLLVGVCSGATMLLYMRKIRAH